MSKAKAKSKSEEKSIEDRCEERVEQLVEDLKEGDFEEFLEILDKINQISGSYSLNNLMLIKMQRPSASIVNGYNQWQDYGRQVQEGEEGITILAPKLYKACPECRNTKKYHEKSDCDCDTPYDDWTKRCFGFKPVTVFGIGQTEPVEGEDSLEVPDLSTKGENCEETYYELKNISEKWVSGIEIDSELLQTSRSALYDTNTEEIRIQPDTYAAKSGYLVHELFHHFVNKSDREFTKNREEIFVEAGSYVVCEELGLDAEDSLKYIKSYENTEEDVDVLKKDIEELVKYSNRIISKLRQE